MIMKELSSKIILNTRLGVLVPGLGHIVKMHYFSKCFLFSWKKIRQIKFMVMMTLQGTTSIEDFTKSVGVLGMRQLILMHFYNSKLLVKFNLSKQSDWFISIMLLCCNILSSSFNMARIFFISLQLITFSNFCMKVQLKHRRNNLIFNNQVLFQFTQAKHT